MDEVTVYIACSGCAALIEDPEPRCPCEQCGDTARCTQVNASSSVMILDIKAHATVERGWPRPWSERLGRCRLKPERLRRAYDAEHLEASGLSSAISDFFVESAHMFDALKHDPAKQLSDYVVFSHIKATALRVGLAYANTYKHTARKNVQELTAYISAQGDTPDGHFAIIKYWSSVEHDQVLVVRGV